MGITSLTAGALHLVTPQLDLAQSVQFGIITGKTWLGVHEMSQSFSCKGDTLNCLKE